LLAKAHKQNKDTKKAIAVLEHALNEVYDEDKTGLFKLINEFKTK
jgi:hypothetical protein